MRRLTTDDILTLTPYVPGKPVEELERELGISGSVKLASNENPLGPSPMALEAAKGALSNINRYPDGAGYHLRQALGEKYGHPMEGIILGNGSNELLELLVRTFLLEGEAAIMAEPSFVVYKMAAQAAGRERVIVPLKDGRHDLEGMADRITGRTKLIFIANPNNPTGTMNTASEMDAFMERVPDGVIVAVDEAYYEYATAPDYPDSMKYLRAGRRMAVLRTFSKAYGLAGLRIGYALTDSELAGLMNRVRQPFNTNSVAQAAAIAALGDTGHVADTVRNNEDGKKYLRGELDRLKVKYLPTQANFIYMDMKRGSAGLYEGLLRKGVIVRPMGPTELRVTIGLPSENVRFIKALEGLL